MRSEDGTGGRPARPIPRTVLVVLAMCGGTAPFAIDAYLAGFPRIARDLETSPSAVQLTLTGFMVTLGLFQLVVGPLSDQIGRRRLLVGGLAASAALAVVCALAPGIEVLVAARLAQGACGAAAVVLARAIVADLASGIGLARAFALLMSVQSLAPVLAPGLGGVLVSMFGWRSVFWFLAALPLALVLAVLAWVPESLPPGRRRAGGLRPAVRDVRALLGQGPYVLAVTMFVSAFAVLFAYVAAGAFVLQDVLGLSQGRFSVVFTGNATMLLVANLVSARVLGGRVTPFGIVRVAGGVQAAAVVWLALVVLVLGTPLWGVLIGFFLLVAATGFMLPNLSARAIEAAGERTGSGSAVLGASQMVVAAIAAPLTGLDGGRTAVPMVVVMLAASVVLAVAFGYEALRRRRRAGGGAAPDAG